MKLGKTNRMQIYKSADAVFQEGGGEEGLRDVMEQLMCH